MNLEVHHIGYLVKDIARSAAAFSRLGYTSGRIVFDPVQKADIQFMSLGDIAVELVAPREESDIYSLLKRYRDAPYHICYTVESINSAIEEMISDGYVLLGEPVKAIAIGKQAKVAFLVKRNMGMIELVEL